MMYKEYTDELFDEVYQNSTINYADGLAELVKGIEYLFKYGIIKADANEVLGEIDTQIQHHTDHHLPKNIDMIYGICGIGKYYEAWLNNFNNRETGIAAFNERALERIVKMLQEPYNTYFNTFSVIHLLCDRSTLIVNRVKAEPYLNYAIDKPKTMAYEDVHFGTYAGTFERMLMLVPEETDLATRIKRLISVHDQANKLSRNIKKKARIELAGKVMGRKTLEIYKRLIASSTESIRN